MRDALSYLLALATLVCYVAALIELYSKPDPSQVVGFPFHYALLVPVALINCVFLMRRPRNLPRFVGIYTLLALLPIGMWFQRYTDLGILALGGDHVWVRAAAEAGTETERRIALAVALEGTQYALNTVETEVLTQFHLDPALQADLFQLLSELAPNSWWCTLYSAQARKAVERIPDDAL